MCSRPPELILHPRHQSHHWHNCANDLLYHLSCIKKRQSGSRRWSRSQRIAWVYPRITCIRNPQVQGFPNLNPYPLLPAGQVTHTHGSITWQVTDIHRLQFSTGTCGYSQVPLCYVQIVNYTFYFSNQTPQRYHHKYANQSSVIIG